MSSDVCAETISSRLGDCHGLRFVLWLTCGVNPCSSTSSRVGFAFIAFKAVSWAYANQCLALFSTLQLSRRLPL